VPRPGAAALPRRRPETLVRPDHLGDFSARPRIVLICLVALAVGGASAVVALGLLRLIGFITNVVFYRRLATGLVAPGAGHHAPLVILLAPVVGGLIVGLMARFGSERIRGHGMPEAIESILVGGSKVQPRVAVLKPISSAVSIGTGGPFGAEGPIIMTGGAVGSVAAQFLKLTADERKTLLVAGAAGGMAATFNAPLASILLAVELLLFEWRPRSYLPVASAVVVSTVVRGYLLGTAPVFGIPDEVSHLGPVVYLSCVVVGITGGLLAVGATGLVYLAEDSFARLPFHWMWWPAIGGLFIGIGGLIQPRALGVGYDVIRELLQGKATLSLIFGILIVKTLIWSVSLGSGTSGGVLAPVFMIGGALGALEGHMFSPVSPGFWALMGLAAVVGGVMRSPFTGVVFSLELTHDWSALLPLVVCASAAYGLSVLVLKRSVLTEKIARRGLHLSREYDVDPLEMLLVHEVMEEEFTSFSPNMSLANAAATFVADHRQTRNAQHRQRLYPVLDADLKLHGVVTRRDMLDAALGRVGAEVKVRDIMVDAIVAYPDETLRAVANRMADKHVSRLPVVDRADPTRIRGLVTLVDLLAGRRKDLQEERNAERIFRVRVRSVSPTTPDDEEPAGELAVR
jgi:H+/Cl- antiporter ClcA/CBS domain-containing protein